MRLTQGKKAVRSRGPLFKTLNALDNRGFSVVISLLTKTHSRNRQKHESEDARKEGVLLNHECVFELARGIQ